MKAFLLRIGVFVPIVLFGVYVLLIAIGSIAEAIGAGHTFYCTIYCKVGVAMLIIALAAVVFCQAKACFRSGK